jgi:TFIIF-interacting CTD phosphatase-like protein
MRQLCVLGFELAEKLFSFRECTSPHPAKLVSDSHLTRIHANTNTTTRTYIRTPEKVNFLTM